MTAREPDTQTPAPAPAPAAPRPPWALAAHEGGRGGGGSAEPEVSVFAFFNVLLARPRLGRRARLARGSVGYCLQRRPLPIAALLRLGGEEPRAARAHPREPISRPAPGGGGQRRRLGDPAAHPRGARPRRRRQPASRRQEAEPTR